MPGRAAIVACYLAFGISQDFFPCVAHVANRSDGERPFIESGSCVYPKGLPCSCSLFPSCLQSAGFSLEVLLSPPPQLSL